MLSDVSWGEPVSGFGDMAPAVSVSTCGVGDVAPVSVPARDTGRLCAIGGAVSTLKGGLVPCSSLGLLLSALEAWVLSIVPEAC